MIMWLLRRCDLKMAATQSRWYECGARID